jgi:DNA-binding CsgD family transcriptional regulator
MQNSGFPERLGAALIEGLAAAWNGPRAQTFERGVEGLCRSVRCGGAWWGLIEGPPDVGAAPSFHLAGSYGLNDDIQAGYAAVYSDDRFAAAVLARPGQVLRWSGTSEEDPPNVRAWVERHRLAHGAALCSHEPFSGQTFVVVLYRFEGGEAFSDDDATLMRFLLEQLVMLWCRSLQDMFNAASAESLSGTLLAKPDGTLLFCGAEMASRLVAMGWDQPGQHVPVAWLQFSGTGGRLRIGDDWAVISEDGEGLRAELASAGQAPSLPTRLLRVAAMFCDGLTAKQIARELELSPATVRTYLRDAYAQLGVRNKLELHGAMRRGRPQTRP